VSKIVNLLIRQPRACRQPAPVTVRFECPADVARLEETAEFTGTGTLRAALEQFADDRRGKGVGLEPAVGLAAAPVADRGAGRHGDASGDGASLRALESSALRSR
jgi:hypothetical protein